MGMFDTLLVAQSQIENLVKENNLLLEAYENYYDFQTKDLDNALTSFYIQADGSFVWKKQNFKWIGGDKNAKFPNNLGHQEPIGEPEFIQDNRPVYIEFYDLYNTEEERVFVTFLAHVKDGKLTEPIKIKKIEKTNLKEEQEKNKPHLEKWDKIRQSKEWKFAEAIRIVKWRISRIFYPLTNWITNFENNLRSKARKKFLNENDIGYW